MTFSLSLKDVSFAFPGRSPLFRGLSLECVPGDILHIQGPNGSGKSTLLQLICGLLVATCGEIKRPDSGEVAYLMAEKNGHLLRFSPLENLTLASQLYGQNASQTELRSLLSSLGFHPASWNLPVCKLSTGMKRKLALARIFLSGASLWVLDEPFNALDRVSMDTVEASLRAHVVRPSRPGSVVLVSHFSLPPGLSSVRTVSLE